LTNTESTSQNVAPDHFSTTGILCLKKTVYFIHSSTLEIALLVIETRLTIHQTTVMSLTTNDPEHGQPLQKKERILFPDSVRGVA